MKKRFLFLACAWLLCLGNMMADEITISDVTVPQGGSADLVVNYKITDSRNHVGFTFMLNLPTGLTLATDASGDLIYVKDNSLSKMNIVSRSDGIIAGQPSSENATIDGTEGTLLTLTLRAGAGLEKGTYPVNVTKVTFQVPGNNNVEDINLEDFTFNVTVGDPLPVVTLDENSDTAPTEKLNTDVIVLRTIKANEWSTICLPFNMKGWQVKASFGDDVQIADFSSWSFAKEGNDITSIAINFTNVTLDDGMEANHPYLIKVSSPVAQFRVDGVDVVPPVNPDDLPCKYVAYSIKNGRNTITYNGNMYGYYVKGPTYANDLFLSENKFWYSTGKTTIKAFRATFAFSDASNNEIVLSDISSSSSRITMTIGNGDASGINEVNNQPTDGQYYDLQGRRVTTPANGIYIRDGKKVTVK